MRRRRRPSDLFVVSIHQYGHFGADFHARHAATGWCTRRCKGCDNVDLRCRRFGGSTERCQTEFHHCRGPGGSAVATARLPRVLIAPTPKAKDERRARNCERSEHLTSGGLPRSTRIHSDFAHLLVTILRRQVWLLGISESEKITKCLGRLRYVLTFPKRIK